MNIHPTNELCNDIRTYTRDLKGRPTGVIIATKSNRAGHRYHIGWAKCNTKLDRFNKHMALTIACGRVTAAEDAGVPVVTNSMPYEVRKMLPMFTERCNRYFK